MRIESPKAYYDRKRKEFENTCPTSTSRGWLRQYELAAQLLCRIGMRDIKPWEGNICCEQKSFEQMRWMNTMPTEDIHSATQPTLRKLDDDGCDIRRLIHHNGFFCDSTEETLAIPAIMKVRLPRRIARKENQLHPRSPTSFCLEKTRIRYAWGICWNDRNSRPLMGRTIAPGMLSAARWGESAAEQWAEMCRKEEWISDMIERKRELLNKQQTQEAIRDAAEKRIEELQTEIDKLTDEGA